MALWEIGDKQRARKLLSRGRTEIQRIAATPDRSGVFPQDWPVVWCFAQAALREAEALIEGARPSAEDYKANSAD